MNVVLIVGLIGFLLTFGVFIGAIALAMVTEQRKNRQALRAMERDFEEIVDRLGDEEGGRT